MRINPPTLTAFGLTAFGLTAFGLTALFAVVVRFWYIACEDKAMRRHFGEAYDACCLSVGRWSGRRREPEPAARFAP